MKNHDFPKESPLSPNDFRNTLYKASQDTNHSVWTIKDNLFDGTAFTFTGDGSYTNYISISHDAFYHTSNPLAGTNHVTLTTLAYAAAGLGSWYVNVAATSPTLENVGSSTAAATGLYHYALRADQTKETNSVVDIGFHYVAVDTNAVPVDTDSDGLADYFEDADGDGSYSGGDLASWINADTDGGGVNDGYEYAHGGSITNCADDYFVDPGMSVGILDSALTRAHGSLPTNWNYFVLPESVKEALRSDGTPFAAVGDCQIAGGLLLPNGKPRFPILICLGAEAVGDDEIAALTNYVAAGGFVLVGSSSFTRDAMGGYRTNFALADQIGLKCTPSTTNWENNTRILKRIDHRLVNHLPDELLTWRMPPSSEETSWGTCVDSHTYAAPHLVWHVDTNTYDMQVLVTGDISPYLTVRQYGNGYFIYHGALNPLIAHGGNGPGMYAYLILRRAIEWAFESAQKPVVKLSPWPYKYDAAFMVRHDLENIVAEISNVTASAQYESNHGATGDYYFCTGAITNAGVDTATIVAKLRQAVSNYGAGIFPHNGGLPNPLLSGDTNSSCFKLPTFYEYFHWGPDEAYNLTNGYAYASNSLLISFNQIEAWVTNQPASPRTWVVPYFNGTRENTYKLQEQLNVKITGEQKLTPFPHWTLSTQTDGKRYPFLSEPVSDWFVGEEIAQVVGPWQGHFVGSPNGVHNLQTLSAAVDFYYTNGFLINFYSHSLTAITNGDEGDAADLMANYVVYCTNKAKIWPSNAREIYQWWLQRSNAQITVRYSTNGNHSVTTVAITGSQHTNTAVEVFASGFGSAVVFQLWTNSVTATTDSYRVSGELIKVRVGTSVTNVQIEYFSAPLARDDFYIVNQTQTLSTVAATGVMSNDWSGTWASLVAITNSLPQHGSLSWNNNGSFTYTPATNGTECFTYQVNDGTYNFGTGNVSVIVTKPGSLYSDDFKRCAANALYPWQVHSGGWGMAGGAMQGSRDGDYGYNYLSPIWTNSNYSVEADVQLGSGTYAGGLGGRLNPAGAHYVAWLYPGENVLRLVKFYNWTDWGTNGANNHYAMKETNLPTIGTAWHPLKLVCSNNLLQVFYHGTNVISKVDTDTDHPVYSSGGVSLDFFNGGLSVTNLVVSPVP